MVLRTQSSGGVYEVHGVHNVYARYGTLGNVHVLPLGRAKNGTLRGNMVSPAEVSIYLGAGHILFRAKLA
jgi:hypothetical protein